MSKANVTILVVAATVLLAVGSAQTNQPTATGPVGRYQLLYGEHEKIIIESGGVAGKTTEHKVILRIDTVTGKTNVWVEGVDAHDTANAKTMFYWTGPIEEFSPAR